MNIYKVTLLAARLAEPTGSVFPGTENLLLLSDGRSLATNGRTGIRVAAPFDAPVAFPEGVEPANPPAEGLQIPPKMAAEWAKKKDVALGRAGGVYLLVSDGCSEKIPLVEGAFPTTVLEEIIDSACHGDAPVTIKVAAALDIFKMLKAMGVEWVELRIRDARHALGLVGRVDGREVEVATMPKAD